MAPSLAPNYSTLFYDLKCINVFRRSKLTNDHYKKLVDMIQIRSYKKDDEITVLDEPTTAALYLVVSGGVWLERAGLAPIKLPSGCNFGEELLEAAEGVPSAQVKAPYTVLAADDDCACAVLTMTACRRVFDIDLAEKTSDIKINMEVSPTGGNLLKKTKSKKILTASSEHKSGSSTASADQQVKVRKKKTNEINDDDSKAEKKKKKKSESSKPKKEKRKSKSVLPAVPNLAESTSSFDFSLDGEDEIINAEQVSVQDNKEAEQAPEVQEARSDPGSDSPPNEAAVNLRQEQSRSPKGVVKSTGSKSDSDLEISLEEATVKEDESQNLQKMDSLASLDEEESMEFGLVDEASAKSKQQLMGSTSNIDALKNRFQGSASSGMGASLPSGLNYDRKSMTPKRWGTSPAPAPSTAPTVRNKLKDNTLFKLKPPVDIANDIPGKLVRPSLQTDDSDAGKLAPESSASSIKSARSMFETRSQPNQKPHYQPTVRKVVEVSDEDMSENGGRPFRKRGDDESAKPPPPAPASVMTPNRFPRKSLTEFPRRASLTKITPIQEDIATEMGRQVAPRGGNDADIAITSASPSFEEASSDSPVGRSNSGDVGPAPSPLVTDDFSAGRRTSGSLSPVKETKKQFDRGVASPSTKPTVEGPRRLSLQVPRNSLKKDEPERELPRNSRRWTVGAGALEDAREKAIADIKKEDEAENSVSVSPRTMTTKIDVEEDLVQRPSSPVMSQADLQISARNAELSSSPLRRTVASPKRDKVQIQSHDSPIINTSSETGDSIVPASKSKQRDDMLIANSPKTPVASSEEKNPVDVSPKRKKESSSQATKGQDSPKTSGSGRSSIVESTVKEKVSRKKHEGTETDKSTKKHESSRHLRKAQASPKSEKSSDESTDKDVKKKKRHGSEETDVHPKPLKGAALAHVVRNAVENKEPKNGSSIARPPKDVFQKPIKVPEDFKPPVYPKTKQEEKTIRHALEKKFVFHHLPEDTKKTLTSAFEKSQVPSGSVIIRQGEENECCYVVSEGECEFTIDGVGVGKVKTGETFGEDSLLCSTHSKASVTTCVDSKLFKIDQTTFRSLLETEATESGRRKRELLQNVDFLEGMSTDNIKKLSDLMVTVKFKKGDVLVGKDDYGKSFFVISEGEVQCKDVKNGRITKPDQTLAAGDYFGKNALIDEVPLMKATVVALTEGEAYKIDRERKDTAMGLATRIPIDARTLHVVRVFDRKPGKMLKPTEIVQLSNYIQDQIFYKGDTILEEGVETEAAVYFLRAGKVHCHVGRQLLVVTPGAHFGDDLFGEAKAKKQTTAISPLKVTAEEDSVCGVLRIQDYFNLFGDDVLKSASTDKPKVAKESKAKIMKESKPENDNIRLDTPKVPAAQIPLLSNLDKRVCLGEGEFGQVWLSVDKTAPEPRPYVLKIQSKYHLVSEGEVEVCIREKNVLRDVSHPLIIELISTYQNEGFVFILLEFVQGGELFSLLNTDECRIRLNENQAKFYALGMADALAYLHEKKYAYRDMKPENILIDSMGYPKLIDFGFTKKVEDRTFTLCGTPGYLAPELVLSQGHSFPVDHWALGVLIYEMLSESSPFYEDGIEQFELFRCIAEEDYLPIDGISPQASALIASLLVKNPTERLGSLARGERDILCHDWFHDLNVRQLRDRQLPAPWTPKIKDVLDTSNFDDWSDVQDKMSRKTPPLRPKDAALFADF